MSVQATGMGCPSAAIVIEELVQLGVKRLLRDRHLRRAATGPAARRPDRGRVGGRRGLDRAAPRRRAARADRGLGLVHGAVHAAKEMGKRLRVGPIVSSDLFYNPDDGQYQRWSDRGIAVEMEAPSSSRSARCAR